MYTDTDSVIYTSFTGALLISIATTDDLGYERNEGKESDPSAKFVSSGPKYYGIRSEGGKSIIKSKGYCINPVNSQLFNFESLNNQVIVQARHIPIHNLTLNKGRTLMRKEFF